jgi:hypothetical protein
MTLGKQIENTATKITNPTIGRIALIDFINGNLSIPTESVQSDKELEKAE